MSIGYACKMIGSPFGTMKSCLLKNASNDILRDIIQNNLDTLKNMLLYNHHHQIRLFRMSSDLIPFATHPVNQLKWWEVYQPTFEEIGTMIKKNDIRVSMHPGQYTLLNSPHEHVVKRSVEDLLYHTKVLDCMMLDYSHKLVIHIGGLYGEKSTSIERFIKTFSTLPKYVRQRIVLENDEKCFHIDDVLKISHEVGVPVVFDLFHHEILSPATKKTWQEWLLLAKSTWKALDGQQKIHYSEQRKEAHKGAHSQTIQICQFINMYKNLPTRDVDIMLEVKDKNLSAIKCINCVNPNTKISSLENEWAKYKYYCLSKSQKNYLKIRELLKDKKCSPLSFYLLVDECLHLPTSKENTQNALMHMWGYFKDRVTDKEKNNFLKNLKRFENDEITDSTLKKYLLKLAEKHQEDYLRNSYYFYIE